MNETRFYEKECGVGSELIRSNALPCYVRYVVTKIWQCLSEMRSVLCVTSFNILYHMNPFSLYLSTGNWTRDLLHQSQIPLPQYHGAPLCGHFLKFSAIYQDNISLHLPVHILFLGMCWWVWNSYIRTHYMWGYRSAVLH